MLRGVDRPIATVAESGHAVFARDDTPERAAYDAARAIDRHREALKWYIRPYSYDSRTVWEDQDVPLHPGAERYYLEAGYLRGGRPCESAEGGAVTGRDAGHGASSCSISTAAGGGPGARSMMVVLVALFARLRRRARSYRRRGPARASGHLDQES